MMLNSLLILCALLALAALWVFFYIAAAYL